MHFGLLGPLEVRSGGSVVPIRGAKQRALLVILLLHANEVVSRDRLLDELWPTRPGGDAEHSLDHQVSRLRKALPSPEQLVTQPGGYVLRVARGEVDAHQFEEELERGRDARAAGDHAEALAALHRGLAQWRGPALADVAAEPFARVEADRLDELRLSAVEEKYDVELELGRHTAVVAELEALVKRHPLRERLRAQLMLALYRGGRQAEALRAYSEGRRAMVDELGLEPGPELRALEQAILRHDPALALPTSARRHRSRRLAAAGAVAVAAAAGIAAAVLTLVGGSSGHTRNGVPVSGLAFVSARTGMLVGRTDGLVAPLDSVFYRGALWNLSFTGILSKIDPQSGRVVGTASTVPIPCGLAAGGGAVWVSDCTAPMLARVDPAHDFVIGRTRIPVARRELADATQSVTVGAGSVWVGQGFDNPSYVWRLDPATGRVLRRYVIPAGGAEALAFGDGALWVGGGVIGRLSRIDPATNAVATVGHDLGHWLCCVAAGGGYVWAAVNPGGTVWKLTAQGEVVSSVKLGGNVEQLRYADGAAWAATGERGSVVRIDATTDITRSYRVGHNVTRAAERSGALAVSVQPAGRDVTAGLKGRIAVVALAEDELDATSTDPLGTQFAFNPAQVQFHYATCAKLFNYPDAAGATGETLVPEVAASMPAVSGAGRVYTFRIRAGFGFSPPSHERVTAASFSHALERFLSPMGGNYDPLRTLGDIVGAAAYAAGKASRVSGISAHGDVLVIRLRRPAGDLPARLSLPSFCAVPAELPTVPHGLPYPIPTAGPYYLAARSNDVLVLRPNPNYHGPRRRHLDAIVYRIGVEPGAAALAIARGSLDYLSSRDAVLAPGTVAAKTAGRRYRLVANNWTERLALNTARPAFADPATRRAVAYALDRNALARALSDGAFQLPTSSLLPPNLRASPFVFPLRRNLASARRLMNGRQVQAVFAAPADEQGKLFEPRVAETLRRELRAIGIRLSIIPLRQTLEPAARESVLRAADITEAGGNADDARDPLAFLLHLPYLPDAGRKQLARIIGLSTPRREAAAESLAARLERSGAYLGFADAAAAEVVSSRLGCTTDQPEYPGLDLASLCVVRG